MTITATDVGATQTLTLIVLSTTVSADARTVVFHRSDTGDNDDMSMDAASTEEDIFPALTALAFSLVTQNVVSAAVAGSTYTGTAVGTSGTYSRTIQALGGRSHADTMTIAWRRNDTGDIANYAANTTATVDDVNAALQGLADDLAVQIQTAADAAAGVAGLVVTAFA